MNAGISVPAGGGGSVGPDGGAGLVSCAGAAGFAGAAAFAAAALGAATAPEAGFAAAGAAGFGAAAALAAFAASPLNGADGCPVTELVSLVAAVVAAAGLSGFGAGGAGDAVGAADTPAPGASVRDTSPFRGSAGVSPAGLSPAALGSLGSSVMNSLLGPCLGPVERAFLPGVSVSGHQNRQEDDHFDETEQRQLVNDDRPRKQEHGFHVEDDKEHGDKVIADTVPIAGVRGRLDAALVRFELHLVVLLRLHQLRHHQGEQREPDGDEQEDEDWYIAVEHVWSRDRGCGERRFIARGQRDRQETQM